MELVIWIVVGLILGGLFGLIPFFVGRAQRKPNLGMMGLVCCMVAGFVNLHFLVMLGFIIAIFCSTRDCAPIFPSSRPAPAQGYYPPTGPAQQVVAHSVTCLSGPLAGRTYRVAGNGLAFGRDGSCAVRYQAHASGVSRFHCKLVYQGSQLMLVDQGSSYGTYLSDGRQLMPNNPVPVYPGSKFSLGGSLNTFRID